jgi:WD40 repeat protein
LRSCLARSLSQGERRRRPLHNVINVVTNLHPKYSSQVNGVSFSADGSLVASCSGDYRGDFSVRMWSVETGQELKKFLGHRCVVSGCCMCGVAVCACSGLAAPARGSPFSASQRRSCRSSILPLGQRIFARQHRALRRQNR